MGSLSLFQGIFSTQGLNPGLPHCRQILNQLSHKGSSRILEWVAYPFSSGSSRLGTRTGVSCLAGGFFTNWAIRENLFSYKVSLALCPSLAQLWTCSNCSRESLTSEMALPSCLVRTSFGWLQHPISQKQWKLKCLVTCWHHFFLDGKDCQPLIRELFPWVISKITMWLLLFLMATVWPWIGEEVSKTQSTQTRKCHLAFVTLYHIFYYCTLSGEI